MKVLDDNEVNQRELIFYLSACLDISIKAADRSGRDTLEDDVNLKVLHDILSTLHHLETMDPDENTQSYI